jgi:hypothetical protein
MPKPSFSGGSKLDAKLKEIAAKLSKAQTVNVGFLEGATYPSGESVAYIASIQEYGATISVDEHTTTIFRQTNKAGTEFNKNGRFVKKSHSNFSSEHKVGAHTFNIPSRPFFRTMIAKESPGWGALTAEQVKAQNYDAAKALDAVGRGIGEQLQKSIHETTSPPLAASTVRKKGFSTPLIDTSVMLNSVDHEVK